MGIYQFPGASFAVRRAVNGIPNMPHDIWQEGDIPNTVGLLQLGIRSETSLDIRFANQGEYLSTEAGQVVEVRTDHGERVLLVDIGNGAGDLKVLSLSATAHGASTAAAQAMSETSVHPSGVIADTQVNVVVPQDASAGVQAYDEPELVSTPEEQAAYAAALTGGGGGALGAAAAATYGTVTSSAPVYEPPPDPAAYYDSGYYTPPPAAAAPGYSPPAPTAPYTPGAAGYEEYAQTQSDLEQLVALGLY